MNNINQIVNRVSTMLTVGLSAVCLAMSVSACGQRGALYMPTSPAAAERASLLDTLTRPAATAPAATPAPASVTTPATTPPAQ